MAQHVVVMLMAAFLLASMTVWVLPKHAHSSMFLMARSPDHLSGEQIEELVSTLKKQVEMELRDEIGKLKKQVDKQDDDLDALVQAARATISPRNASSANLSAKLGMFPGLLPSVQADGRRLSGLGAPLCTGCGSRPLECWSACSSTRGYCSNCDTAAGARGACCRINHPGVHDADDPSECHATSIGHFLYTGYHTCVVVPTPMPPAVSRTPAIAATAEFFSQFSVTSPKWASLPGYVQDNFWASTMSTLVGDTTTLTSQLVLLNGVVGVSSYETALVALGLGLASPILSMVNPCLGTLAAFGYAMFNTQRSSGDLVEQTNAALQNLYERVMEETRAYTDSKIELEMLNAAQNANREAIAAVMDEMLWVPDMLDQTAGQEDAEHKQTRVMYQLVLQHDLAKLSAAVFGACVHDANSDECTTWQERGTFVQALVFATIHLQVLNDIAISDTRYMSVISTRLKEVSAKYHYLLKQSVEAMDRKVKCDIGVSSYCEQNGVRIAELSGLWFHAPRNGMSCNEVCAEQENMVFDIASSQHKGNQAGKHFHPNLAAQGLQASWGPWGCTSIEHTMVGYGNFQADGSTPDGNCHSNDRVSCACKYVAVSNADDPDLLIKFDPVIASFNIGKCTAPTDGMISGARDAASGGPCAEGLVFDIAGGSATCTARCKDGFEPSLQAVPCTSGYPDVLFECTPVLSYTKFGNGPCRATSPTDNPAPGTSDTWPAWYYLHGVACDLSKDGDCVAACQHRCDVMHECIAFEARQDGVANRCEIWLREPLAYGSPNDDYTCLKKDTHTPHFAAFTAGQWPPPPTEGCVAEGGSPATEEGCEFACKHQQVAGAIPTRYSVGSWSHSPGCFVVVDGQYKGGCHWNTNTGAGSALYNGVYTVRSVCTKPDSKTLANCVDTNNGATGWYGKTCQYYHESPEQCDGGYYYMDEDFTPHDMCCACGGGIL
jgi:hypothetical protein